MKNQIIKIGLASFIIFCVFNTAHADTAIQLKITTPTSTIYNQNITVIPCDSDNDSTTVAIATPYCAILQSGIPSDWSWDTTYKAYYLNSLDNISGSTTKDPNGKDVYNFWDWSLNGSEATTGLSEHELQANDTILVNFVDPGNTTQSVAVASGPLLENTTIATTASTAPPTPIPPAVVATPTTPSFDTNKAVDFLTAQQQKDGSFGTDLYTDWVGLALASGNNQPQTTKLIKYFASPARLWPGEEDKLLNSTLTDYERHAMALMAFGLNPYDTNGENYINDIVKSFDGKQFGDPGQDNDDIFALIVLQNAGYTQNDSIISAALNFILSKQNADGSWDSSVDMTGAAMEALSTFNQNDQVKTALGKAENFLEKNQKADGSWNDNASSTAWEIEGILAQNEKPADWTIGTNKNSPLDYLASIQDTDGGVKDSDLNTKIWETAYVVSALSGKTWNQTMQSFDKEDLPAPVVINPTTPTQKTTNTKIISIKKIKNSPIPNTASVINVITSPTPTTSQKNWLLRLLDRIF